MKTFDHMKSLPGETQEVLRELHDRVLQHLNFMMAGGYGQLEEADDYRAAAAQATSELRAIMYGVPKIGSLADALRHVRDSTLLASDAPALHIDIAEACHDFAAEDYRALIGAARESVVNASFHSQGGLIEVRSWVNCAAVCVTVTDNGVGTAPDAVDGFGITECIVDRMVRAGGGANLESNPEGGLRVVLWHPLSARDMAVAVEA